MTIKPLKTGLLRNSQRIISSNKYVISLTGKRAVIMDRSLNFITELDKLYYVYNGQISPNEKTLLLISSGNIFYLYSLETFELMHKVTLRGTYSGNLEGRGCFSHDGKHIILILDNEKECISTLRVYNVDNLDEYKDYLENEYLLYRIIPVKSCMKYAIVGSPGYEARCKGQNYNVLIWFDGQHVENHILPGKDDYISNVEVSGDDRLTIYRGFSQVFDVNFNGEIIDSSSEQFDISKDEEKNVDAVKLFDGISAVCFSSVYPYCYIGTSNSLLIYSTAKKEIVLRIPLKYGVLEVTELNSEIISVVTFDKQIMFKVICDE